MDTTFGTNQEKRPLFKMIGRDASNRNIPLLCAFLPSLSGWVFHWIFQDVLPPLLGKENLQKLRLVTTDEDTFCINAFLSLKDHHYMNCLIRLCKWHKVNRNYTTKVMKWCQSDADRSFVGQVANWMYSFTKEVETLEEETESKNALLQFVSTTKNQSISAQVLTQTQLFLTQSFWKSLPRLSLRHFLHVPNGDRGDNCAIESENSSLKRNRSGPKPYQPLNSSGKAVVNRDSRYLQDYLHNVNWEMSATPQPQRQESMEQQVLRELEIDIVPRKARLAVSQWKGGIFGNYEVSVPSSSQSIRPCYQNGEPMFDEPPQEFQAFLVSHKGHTQINNHPRPRPNRTRYVTNWLLL